jgi:hypothetical protein
MNVNENQLDNWVRGNAEDAQGVIVELVWRLVSASSPTPRARRFPLGDSIGQPGADGFLDATVAYNPFVPAGKSFWEIGTGEKPGKKATSDYKDLVEATPEDVRKDSTFIFVTPLSGRHETKWAGSWKPDARERWLSDRKKRNEWRDVVALGGTEIIDWLRSFPSVDIWLARRMGLPVQQMETLDGRWNLLRTIGSPPPLPPELFLANRDDAAVKLRDFFNGDNLQLRLETHYPDQLVDVVASTIATLDAETRADVLGRSVVVSGADAFDAMMSYRERHVLVADFDLADANSASVHLLQKAKLARHAVIFAAPPGGLPHTNRTTIPNPKPHQIQEVLEKAGYPKERARMLAQKSSGNIGALLRFLQHLSLSPEWAEPTTAGDLVIADLIGGWNEGSATDTEAVESVLGKPYGEWIASLREVALRPSTPLTQRNGIWKVVSRYEAWYALGPAVFDRHLQSTRELAVKVLSERDPQFDLAPDDRYAAAIYGKKLRYSASLRAGLANTLALLGNHTAALTSTSVGAATRTAALAVRDILQNADGILWASLGDLLPLLAEASPSVFLELVESALKQEPSPFDYLFAQEGDGLMRTTYVSGLLWALETLAWDSALLPRVILALGELAARDPGGKWTNRPDRSIRTILLPWHPQTTASVQKRTDAVRALLTEQPEVGWKVLLTLLPDAHQVTSGTRRPAWQTTIDESWSETVSMADYREQTTAYAEIALGEALIRPGRLSELVERIDDLPPTAYEKALEFLTSPRVAQLDDDTRTTVWSALTAFVSKHRRFPDAEWALSPEQVSRVAGIADSLAPSAAHHRHRRLFTQREYELYDPGDNWKQQQAVLAETRTEAVSEIVSTSGIDGAIAFALTVETPWRVGFALGTLDVTGASSHIFPRLLQGGREPAAQFVEGFVRGQFSKGGWQWVDSLDASTWHRSEIGVLFSCLPFTQEAWDRVSRLLGADEAPYWKIASANPFEARTSLRPAVSHLLDHGRPTAAIQCLDRMRHEKEPLESAMIVRALLDAVRADDQQRELDTHAVVELIAFLQEDKAAPRNETMIVEWAFLPLLDGHHGHARPRLLEESMASDPAFFCDVIRMVFKPSDEGAIPDEAADAEEKPTEDEEVSARRESRARNAYRLLSQWQLPPGAEGQGRYDGAKLVSWLDGVRARCTASGHLGIAMTYVGHVLTYVPSDPDGLWIHRAAADALNQREAADMRDGYSTQLYNSRGVHGFSAGKAERNLADRYRKRAEDVEAAGYTRLGSTLRERAASYDRAAEREAARDPFDD